MKAEPGTSQALVRVEGLAMGFGEVVVQKDLTFEVHRGRIFGIVGPSGCGKSTLLRHLIGLNKPSAGHVYFGGEDFWALDEHERRRLLQDIGVLFQSAALWSDMTVAENIALPLELYTDLEPGQIADQVAFKLALVGLAGASEAYPAALSGGMRKRAGLARALALDPPVLFLDEPSAGLDPLSVHRLDELILRLRDALGVTVVMVTHELESLFAIADDCLYLDPESTTAIGLGAPRALQRHSEYAQVREFLSTRV